MLMKKEIIENNKRLKQEIVRLNNIINELESELYHDWLEYKDSDCESMFSKAIEDKAIYDYIQELKESNKRMISRWKYIFTDDEIEKIINELEEQDRHIKEANIEIERLNNIIKEVREYLDEWNMNWYSLGSEEDHQRLEELLEILDKENRK